MAGVPEKRRMTRRVVALPVGAADEPASVSIAEVSPTITHVVQSPSFWVSQMVSDLQVSETTGAEDAPDTTRDGSLPPMDLLLGLVRQARNAKRPADFEPLARVGRHHVGLMDVGMVLYDVVNILLNTFDTVRHHNWGEYELMGNEVFQPLDVKIIYAEDSVHTCVPSFCSPNTHLQLHCGPAVVRETPIQNIYLYERTVGKTRLAYLHNCGDACTVTPVQRDLNDRRDFVCPYSGISKANVSEVALPGGGAHSTERSNHEIRRRANNYMDDASVRLSKSVEQHVRNLLFGDKVLMQIAHNEIAAYGAALVDVRHMIAGGSRHHLVQFSDIEATYHRAMTTSAQRLNLYPPLREKQIGVLVHKIGQACWEYIGRFHASMRNGARTSITMLFILGLLSNLAGGDVESRVFDGDLASYVAHAILPLPELARVYKIASHMATHMRGVVRESNNSHGH